MIDIQLFTKKNETWKINQRFWKRIEILCDKLQFVCLIGGAGYKPAPQIADIYTQWINLNFVYIQK